jgi:serine/threonine-protein kinase
MRFEEIQAAVRDEVGDELEALHAEWLAQGAAPAATFDGGTLDKGTGADGTHAGDEALDGFVAWLHERGRIGQDTFRSLHADGEVHLNNLATLATYFEDDDSLDEPTDEAPINTDTAAFPIRTRLGPKPAHDASARFAFLGKLAAGAMGEIHIARDKELQRKVAVKRMTDKVKRSNKLSSRFYTEAQVTAQLDHPNIVPVYSLEADPEGGLAYTMKLIKGKTFTQLIADVREGYEEGRPPDEDHDLSARLEWFLRVCDAIAYAHDRGVIHRDLKPDNIMVGKFGEVFVMDWGIARLNQTSDGGTEELVDMGGEGSAGRTRLGTVIGTPAYMSPEQAEGNNDLIDGRSDEFALGLILFELCCLKQALTGRDTMSLLLKVQRAELEAFEGHPKAPPLAPELKAIVARATHRDPDQRYPGVKQLADDVRRFLRGEVTEALPHGVWRRTRTWLSQHTTLLLATLLVSGAITGFTGITGLTTILVQRVAAEEREAQLADLLGIVSGQAHALDARMFEYQGLLKVLASNAVEAVQRDQDSIGPEGDAYFVSEPFRPPDLTHSARYDTEVSIGWPVFKLPDTLTPEQAVPSIRQLTLLRHPMRRLLLSSISESAVGLPPEQEEQQLLSVGSPIAWAYVALENGVLAHYPGHNHFPSPYDATRRPWYKLVAGQRGPQWGSPQVDFGGLGMMLPCSMGLYDDDGRQLGVAGIELPFDYLIDHVLEAPQLQEVAEAYVIDADGRIVVQSADKRRSRTDSGLGKHRVRLKSFPVEAVLDARVTRANGRLSHVNRRGKRELLVWYALDSARGWSYVVRGEEKALLQAMADLAQ